MAFSFTIDGRIKMPPSYKRETQGEFWRIFGTFTNAGGDTGGEIQTGFDKVVAASFSNLTAANAIKTVLNSAADGEITITTTDGDDGTWEALVYNR